MTQEERNEILRHIEVEMAYLDGKEIEYNRIDNDKPNWKSVSIPIWDWDSFDYRVKPEAPKPKVRPYANADEIMQAIKEHGGYVKEDNTYRYIKKFTCHETGHITYSLSGWGSTNTRDWESIHDKIVWADGTPFGVLENKE